MVSLTKDSHRHVDLVIFFLLLEYTQTRAAPLLQANLPAQVRTCGLGCHGASSWRLVKIWPNSCRRDWIIPTTSENGWFRGLRVGWGQLHGQQRDALIKRPSQQILNPRLQTHLHGRSHGRSRVCEFQQNSRMLPIVGCWIWVYLKPRFRQPGTQEQIPGAYLRTEARRTGHLTPSCGGSPDPY